MPWKTKPVSQKLSGRVADRLPIVYDTLEATQIYIEKHPASANSGGLQLIIKACETRANQLKEIFHKVAPLGEDSRADRYLKAVRTMGKGAGVESLIKGILEDLQLLVGNHLVNMTSGEHIKDLATTIKEISSIEPSIPEGEFPDSGNVFNQYGSGHMFNATGGKNLYNLGDGNQFQGENFYFGEIFKQKA